MNNVTFKRVANGQFESYLNGEKTKYQIHNGSLGVSGRGDNVYGVTWGENIKWLGPLRTCKQLVIAKIQKDITA